MARWGRRRGGEQGMAIRSIAFFDRPAPREAPAQSVPVWVGRRGYAQGLPFLRVPQMETLIPIASAMAALASMAASACLGPLA